MKAISLWQPWASLMAVNAKRIETRGWPIAFRGDIAICSTVGTGADSFEILKGSPFQQSLYKEYAPKIGDPVKMKDLPCGFVLCVVELYDCKSTKELLEECLVTSLEMEFGNYGPERFGWLTRNCRKLERPVPVKGRQGLFNLPSEIEFAVNVQIL